MSFAIMPRAPRRFVAISAYKQVGDAIAFAVAANETVRIVSEPGHGKSTALVRHANETHAVYCQVAAFYKTVQGLYKMIMTASGQVHYSRQTNTLAEVLYSLDWQGVPLFVDEYQTLELTAQRELLNIQQHCRMPLILSGNGQSLASRTMDKELLAQISDRFAMDVRLGGLTEADCHSVGIEYNVEGKDAYAAISAYGQRTNIRQLARLLDQCETITENTGSIKLHHIETSALLIHGSEGALDLFKPL